MEKINTNELFETAAKQGASADFIETFEKNFDLAEIQNIIASCDTQDEAFQKLHEKYPVLKIEELKKQFDEYAANMNLSENSESEEVVDLEDDALEAVAGGSIGSWLKKNWAGLAVGVVCTVAGAALGSPMIGAMVGQTAMGLVNSQVAKKDQKKDAETDQSHNF